MRPSFDNYLHVIQMGHRISHFVCRESREKKSERDRQRNRDGGRIMIEQRDLGDNIVFGQP
jgi:hypothetical protein